MFITHIFYWFQALSGEARQQGPKGLAVRLTSNRMQKSVQNFVVHVRRRQKLHSYGKYHSQYVVENAGCVVFSFTFPNSQCNLKSLWDSYISIRTKVLFQALSGESRQQCLKGLAVRLTSNRMQKCAQIFMVHVRSWRPADDKNYTVVENDPEKKRDFRKSNFCMHWLVEIMVHLSCFIRVPDDTCSTLWSHSKFESSENCIKKLLTLIQKVSFLYGTCKW